MENTLIIKAIDNHKLSDESYIEQMLLAEIAMNEKSLLRFHLKENSLEKMGKEFIKDHCAILTLGEMQTIGKFIEFIKEK